MGAVCNVINQSSRVSARQLAVACAAATTWATRVAQAWNVPAVTVRPAKTTVGATHSAIYILDGLDVDGALGYHDVVAGRPVGKVDAQGCAEYGLSWTVTLTHELGEIMVDPWCIAAAQYGANAWIAYELCDPVEADQFGSVINGVRVSDYLLPAYFSGGAGPYDAYGHLSAPAPALISGGYASVCVNGQWSQITHGRVPSARAAASRRHQLRIEESARFSNESEG